MHVHKTRPGLLFTLAFGAALGVLSAAVFGAAAHAAASTSSSGASGNNPAASQAADESDATGAEQSTTSQWIDFTDPHQGFGISFPAKPKITAKAVSGQTPLVQHDYLADPDDSSVYEAVVFEFPRGDGPIVNIDYYQRVVAGYAKGVGSNVVKQGPVTLGGLQAYEAVALDKNGNAEHLIDIIPSSDRVYLLVTAGGKGHAKSDEAMRFRDSFHLVKPGAAQSASQTGSSSTGSADTGDTGAAPDHSAPDAAGGEENQQADNTKSDQAPSVQPAQTSDTDADASGKIAGDKP